MLRENQDSEFVWALVQQVSRMKWAKDDPIYWKGDISESIYMIYKGSVKMMTENGVQFTVYKRGDIIGDSEALFEDMRDSKAVAAETCVLYILKLEDCKDIFAKYPSAYLKLKQDAKKKKHIHAEKILEARKKRPMFWMEGGLDDGLVSKL